MDQKIKEQIVHCFLEGSEIKVGSATYSGWEGFRVSMSRVGTHLIRTLWQNDNRIVWEESNAMGEVEIYYSIKNEDSAEIMNYLMESLGREPEFEVLAPQPMVTRNGIFQYNTHKYRLKDNGMSYQDYMMKEFVNGISEDAA